MSDDYEYYYKKDETPTTIFIDTHQYDYRRSIFQ